jgi:hypothetical protein
MLQVKSNKSIFKVEKQSNINEIPHLIFDEYNKENKLEYQKEVKEKKEVLTSECSSRCKSNSINSICEFDSIKYRRNFIEKEYQSNNFQGRFTDSTSSLNSIVNNPIRKLSDANLKSNDIKIPSFLNDTTINTIPNKAQCSILGLEDVDLYMVDSTLKFYNLNSDKVNLEEFNEDQYFNF